MGRRKRWEMEVVLGEKIDCTLMEICKEIHYHILGKWIFIPWCSKIYIKETNRKKKKKSICQIECCTEAREICLDMNKLLFCCEHCTTKITLHPLVYPGPKTEGSLYYNTASHYHCYSIYYLIYIYIFLNLGNFISWQVFKV